MVSSLHGPYNGPAGHEMTDDARPCLVQVAKNTIFLWGYPKRAFLTFWVSPKMASDGDFLGVQFHTAHDRVIYSSPYNCCVQKSITFLPCEAG